MMSATCTTTTTSTATNFTSVPIIDIAALISKNSTTEEKLNVAKQLGDAAEKIGFFQIINHGIETPLSILEFFNLPLDSKMKLAQRHHQLTNNNRYRGYFPLQEGNSSYKEGIEFGPEKYELKFDYDDTTPANRHRLLLHEPSVYPDETEFPQIKGFRTQVQQYYQSLLSLGGSLMTGLALALDLPANYFDSSFQHSVSTLRFLEYPVKPAHVIEATPADSKGISCGQHTDSGILTLLYQDEVGGLQVRNAAGTWIDVPPTPGALVINLGDLLQRWTNNKWISTVHRVKEGSKIRHSIPFFFEPSFDCVVSTLAPCRSSDGSTPYPDVIYGRYVIEKMQSFIEYRDLFVEENTKQTTTTQIETETTKSS